MELLELPNLNLSYPREMMVSDKPITKENPGYKKVVICYLPKLLYAYIACDYTLEEYNEITNKPDGFGLGAKGRWEAGRGVGWQYAKTPIIELSLQEIADKFNIKVENLKIVH